MSDTATGHKTYLLFNRLDRQSRFFITIIFLIAGIALQMRYSILIGLVVILCASLLNIFRSIKLIEPVSISQNWERVTLDEVGKAFERVKGLKDWKTLSSGVKWILAIIFIPVGLILFAILAEYISVWYLVMLDFFILFVPLFISGTRTGWTPPNLELKLKVLSKVLEYDFIKTNPDLRIQPYMLIAKDAAEANYPVDCKLMIEFAKAPKDFIGVQVQVSVNSIGSMSYPYAYAVIIAKDSAGLPLANIKSDNKNILCEPKKEHEMDILVIRQFTSKTSGYQTNDEVLYQIVQKAVTSVVGLEVTKH